ncbi:SPOR domain-containing protein [Gallaecimonas sp. GXIMD4217]|uniref:SPOR domain-containing protein n=1 Tax=Gallaecimonas sp. GXIMD4217 TaxID=3131927 RepID=UPI00311B1AF6
MARKDYVRNSAPKRRPARRAPAKKGQGNPRSVPWLAILIFLVAAGAFGYLLYGLATSPKPDPAPVQQDKPKPAKQQARDSLPPPPKEEWQYVETLKNKEVTVEVPDKPETTKRYQMQCGSFKSRSQAEAMKAKIAFQGLESQVRHAEGSAWYRVVLGPYQGKRPAERDKHKLERAKIITCQIWGWTDP